MNDSWDRFTYEYNNNYLEKIGYRYLLAYRVPIFAEFLLKTNSKVVDELL